MSWIKGFWPQARAAKLGTNEITTSKTTCIETQTKSAHKTEKKGQHSEILKRKVFWFQTLALQSGIEQVSRRKLGDSRFPLTKVGIFQEFKHLLLLQGTQLFHGQKSCVEKKQGCHEKACSYCFFCKEVNQECGKQIKLLSEMLLKIAEKKYISGR